MSPLLSVGAGWCGGAPKADASACCVADEVAKAEGTVGCGCGTPRKAELATSE